MDNKIDLLYQFLIENRTYNKSLQERFYKSVIIHYNSIPEKIASLLYHIANTQSQPKIDKLAEFYKKLYENNLTDSFANFITLINPGKVPNYNSLFEGLHNQPGWGKKTSALFTKSIFHLHNGQYDNELKIWNDAPKTIDENDDFYLPVDAVIIAIFDKIDSSKTWNFDNINKALKAKYKINQIEIWDDLWFWGFINQHGSVERKFLWNENKYWALKETDKNKDNIEEIKTKSIQFINILNN